LTWAKDSGSSESFGTSWDILHENNIQEGTSEASNYLELKYFTDLFKYDHHIQDQDFTYPTQNEIDRQAENIPAYDLTETPLNNESFDDVPDIDITSYLLDKLSLAKIVNLDYYRDDILTAESGNAVLTDDTTPTPTPTPTSTETETETETKTETEPETETETEAETETETETETKTKTETETETYQSQPESVTEEGTQKLPQPLKHVMPQPFVTDGVVESPATASTTSTSTLSELTTAASTTTSFTSSLATDKTIINSSLPSLSIGSEENKMETSPKKSAKSMFYFPAGHGLLFGFKLGNIFKSDKLKMDIFTSRPPFDPTL